MLANQGRVDRLIKLILSLKSQFIGTHKFVSVTFINYFVTKYISMPSVRIVSHNVNTSLSSVI